MIIVSLDLDAILTRRGNMYKKELNFEVANLIFGLVFTFDRTQFNVGGEVGYITEKCEECEKKHVPIGGFDLFLGFINLSCYVM